MNPRRRTDPLIRFERYVDRSAGPDGCWPWLAKRLEKGHGVFFFGRVDERKRTMPAHRFALEQALGRALGAGQNALHRCDNPPCVNPAHLFEGTIAENNADAARKGRMHQRLSFEQVTDLRLAARAGATGPELGRRFGIHQSTARRIAMGLRRPHVPMPA